MGKEQSEQSKDFSPEEADEVEAQMLATMGNTAMTEQLCADFGVLFGTVNIPAIGIYKNCVYVKGSEKGKGHFAALTNYADNGASARVAFLFPSEDSKGPYRPFDLFVTAVLAAGAKHDVKLAFVRVGDVVAGCKDDPFGQGGPVECWRNLGFDMSPDGDWLVKAVK
ncbi:hypothetical protein JW710_00720 [Candidatus Dojkabacteria bacterium]|nr:hypothetical protein [Candidatus Dojkabacteria bacterium]